MTKKQKLKKQEKAIKKFNKAESVKADFARKGLTVEDIREQELKRRGE